MAITVDSVSPAVVDSEGGRLLTVTGTGFELLKTYNVHVGAVGDATDPACYAGQGKGINITPKSVTTLECFLPPLPTGTILSVFGVQSDDSGVNDLLADPLTVIEPQQSSSIFSMRRLFAPNRAIGKRTFDLFPATESPKNLLVQSGNLGFSVWDENGLDGVDAIDDDPFGGTDGFKIAEDTSTGIHSVSQPGTVPNSVNLTAGQLYTLAVYAKADFRDWMSLTVNDGINPANIHTFDVVNGIVGQFILGGGFVRIRPASYAGSTGWFRVELTFRSLVTKKHDVAFGIASSASTISFTGVDEDSTRLAFPSVDEYPLARAYRATGVEPIL